MLKKVILIVLCCSTITAYAQFDMTMDRVSTTDIPEQLGYMYYEPRNPTRPCCINCPERENRWAQCSCPNLHIDDYCHDFQDDCIHGRCEDYYWMPYECMR